MTTPLRPLPADYAPGDTPTAAEMNGLKDHAGNSIERLTTVVRRGTLVQAMPHNTLNSTSAVQFQTVVGGYNGIGWAVGTPSRFTCPSGGNGRYEIKFTGSLAPGAGGLRAPALAKNGALAQLGAMSPGDASLSAWLNASWETSMVAGDYVEVWVFQNKTTVGTLNLDVVGESPQATIKRVEL